MQVYIRAMSDAERGREGRALGFALGLLVASVLAASAVWQTCSPAVDEPARARSGFPSKREFVEMSVERNALQIPGVVFLAGIAGLAASRICFALQRFGNDFSVRTATRNEPITYLGFGNTFGMLLGLTGLLTLGTSVVQVAWVLPSRWMTGGRVWHASHQALGFEVIDAGFASDNRVVAVGGEYAATGGSYSDRYSDRTVRYRHDGWTALVPRKADNEYQFFDVRTGKPDGPPLQVGSGKTPVVLDISPDRKRLLVRTTTKGRVWLVWDVGRATGVGPTLDLTEQAKHEVEQLEGAAFSPCGSFYVTWSQWGFGCWDTETGQPRNRWVRQDELIRQVVVLPDAATLLTSSTPTGGKGRLQMWRIADGERVGPPFGEAKDYYTGLQVSDNGKTLLGVMKLGMWESRAQVWDLPTRSLKREIGADGTEALFVALSPDGTRVAVSTARTENVAPRDQINQTFVETAAGEVVGLLKPDRGMGAYQPGFLPDGAAVVCFTGTAFRTYAVPERVPLPAFAKTAAIDADGRFRPESEPASALDVRHAARQQSAMARWGRTASLSSEDELIVYDANGGAMGTLGKTEREGVAVSPDGRYALTTDRNGVTLWRLPVASGVEYGVTAIALASLIGGVSGVSGRGGLVRVLAATVVGCATGIAGGWAGIEYVGLGTAAWLWPFPVAGAALAFGIGRALTRGRSRPTTAPEPTDVAADRL